MKIPFTNRCPDLPSPRRASLRAAGYDLRAAVEENFVLLPGARAVVPTGISAAIPEGFEGQVRARSGLAARHGIAMVNAPGTIDSDYRGEIAVIVVNLGEEPFTIERGDRIAQLVICPVELCDFEQVDSLDSTDRGTGGFGSTGKQ